MNVLIGKTSGFCYGVKRAVEGAINEVVNNQNSGKPVCCLGDLVHNNQVIEKLKDLGINCIEKIDEAKGITIVRAHGVPKEVYEIAKQKNIVLKDYTCPNVLKIHEIVQKYTEKGYFIMLLGNKKHPENIGTLSYCNYYYVIEREEDVSDAINAFKNSKIKKLLLISQTTFSMEKFHKIEKLLKNQIETEMNNGNNSMTEYNNVEFVIKNTICRATELRQKETEELSKKVDMMIIIGGKNSSNTKKLYEIAQMNCQNVILVENVEELKFQNDVENVGIMAGASTPKESIDDVVSILTSHKVK